MNAENALKQQSKVKYVVVTNPKGDITMSKLSIPSIEQRQIMDVLDVDYIKSEIWESNTFIKIDANLTLSN